MPTKNVSGVCSRSISYDIDDEGLVQNVSFVGGCSGNLKAVSILSEGRPVSEVIELLEGVTCGNKATSCPDQFAKALKEDV